MITIRKRYRIALTECGLSSADSRIIVDRYLESDLGKAICPTPDVDGKGCHEPQIIAWWIGICREALSFMDENGIEGKPRATIRRHLDDSSS